MDKAAKERLHTLINPFRLAIRLRVVSSAALQRNARLGEQLLPELTSEHSVTI